MQSALAISVSGTLRVATATGTQVSPRIGAIPRASASSSSDIPPDLARLSTQGWLDYLLAAADFKPTSRSGSHSAFSVFSEGWDDDSRTFMINAGEEKESGDATAILLLLSHQRQETLTAAPPLPWTGDNERPPQPEIIVSPDSRVRPPHAAAHDAV